MMTMTSQDLTIHERSDQLLPKMAMPYVLSSFFGNICNSH